MTKQFQAGPRRPFLKARSTRLALAGALLMSPWLSTAHLALKMDMGEDLPPVIVAQPTPLLPSWVPPDPEQCAPTSAGATRSVLASLAAAGIVDGQRELRMPHLAELLNLPNQLPLEGQPIPSLPLNLEQALSLGVTHSLEVQANQARSDSFAYTRDAARGALLPHLDGRAAAGRGRLESDASEPLTDRREGTLTLRQPLFDVTAFLEWRRQGRLSDAASRQLDAAINDAALESASAYIQALQARLVMELNRDYERLLQELLDHINTRAAGGGASVAERDRVRARTANARAQIADARANLSAALRNLSTLTGVSADALQLELPAQWAAPATLEHAVQLANDTNPELLAARLEGEAAKLEAQANLGRYLPRVDLELSHTRNVNGAGTPSYLRDSKALVVVNWSLLNGSADFYQGQAAKARQQEKLARTADVQRKLRQQFEGAYAALDALQERNQALKEEVQANATVVDAFRSQLGMGNRSLLDVLDACQRLHQSRIDAATLMITEMQNHLKVAHLTGKLGQGLPASTSTPN